MFHFVSSMQRFFVVQALRWNPVATLGAACPYPTVETGLERLHDIYQPVPRQKLCKIKGENVSFHMEDTYLLSSDITQSARKFQLPHRIP